MTSDILQWAEAIASSEIEGIRAPISALARRRPRADAAGWVYLNYLALDESTHYDMQRVLMQGRDWAVGVRQIQNWIGSQFHVVYLPPPPEDVPALLAQLDTSIARQDTDLVRWVTHVHCEFERIHPYPDGNGRTGRALIWWKTGLPVSRVIARSKRDYVEALTRFRECDHRYAEDYFAEVLREARDERTALRGAVEEVRAQSVQDVGARRGSTARMLCERLPLFTTVGEAMSLTGASERRAYAALARLEDAGVLHEATGQRRNRTWFSPDLAGILGV